MWIAIEAIDYTLKWKCQTSIEDSKARINVFTVRRLIGFIGIDFFFASASDFNLK